MRARLVKPEFFRDKKIGKLGPIPALVFEALWLMADDGGAVLCNPEVVKGEMFMYWPMMGLPEISQSLEQLATETRIERYTIGDNEYALIVNFEKHQPINNPSKFRHPRPTKLADDKLRQDYGRTTVDSGGLTSQTDLGQEVTRSNGNGLPEDYGRTTPPIHLTSSSPKNLTTGVRREYSPQFNELRSAYPKRSGGDSKEDAYREYQARIKQGATHEEIYAGTLRYKVYCDATKKTGTEYVKQQCTFLGRSRHYLEPWEIPASNGTHRAAENVKRGYV